MQSVENILPHSAAVLKLCKSVKNLFGFKLWDDILIYVLHWCPKVKQQNDTYNIKSKIHIRAKSDYNINIIKAYKIF